MAVFKKLLAIACAASLVPSAATAAPFNNFVSFYAARSALKTIVLDKNPAVGALAITHKIANYPGISAVLFGVLGGPIN